MEGICKCLKRFIFENKFSLPLTLKWNVVRIDAGQGIRTERFIVQIDPYSLVFRGKRSFKLVALHEVEMALIRMVKDEIHVAFAHVTYERKTAGFREATCALSLNDVEVRIALVFEILQGSFQTAKQ